MPTVYSGTTNHWRAWMTYSVEDRGDSIVVSARGGPEAVAWGFNINSVSVSITCTWGGTKSGTCNFYSPTGGNGWSTGVNATWTIPKDHSNYNNGTISCTVTNSSYMAATLTASGSFSCSSKWSYTVSYNANGGSGAPGAQTKWYNETLKLSSTVPTRSGGYTFKGWSTSANGAVSYSAGGNYANNSGATLYAVWNRSFLPPSISAATVGRGASGTGTAIRVAATFTANRTNSSANAIASATAETRAPGGSWSSAAALTLDGSSTSQTRKTAQNISGTFAEANSYEVRITCKDSNGLTASAVYTVAPVSALFELYKSGSTKGISLGKVCPGAGVHIQGNPFTLNGLQLCNGTSDVAGQIRSAIGVTDSGWQSSAGDGWLFVYRKYGPVVVLFGYSGAIAAGGWYASPLALPAQFRPRGDLQDGQLPRLVATVGNTPENHVARAEIRSDGKVYVFHYGSTAPLSIGGAWMV